MMVNKDVCKLIADLEFLIGKECYNPKSYDGWNDIEGCSFRYPINVPDKDGDYRKCRSNINNYDFFESEDINEILSSIQYMKYKFGSNELFVGQGIISILEYLEKRYNLNFIELEENRKD